MHSRAVRITLLGLLLAVGIGAGIRVWTIERGMQTTESRRRALDTILDRVTPAIAGIAAAQQAYVDFGLRNDASFARVSSLIVQVTTDAAGLRSSDYSGNAVAHLEEFWTALSALTSAETQAKAARNRGDDLAAADILLATPRPQVAIMDERVRAFREAEIERLRLERSRLAQQSWVTLGVVAIVWVAGLLALVPLPAPGGESLPAADEPLVPLVPTSTIAPSPIPEPKPAPAAATNAAAASKVDRPAAVPTPANAVTAPSSVDLTATAALCAAITQVSDTSALPAVLEQSARLLDARGIIVWMGAGEDLFPAAAFGYDPAMIGRLRHLARSSDNATATAWRTGELRTVAASASSLGAIVAPMFGGNGCIGVLAAEVRNGRERDHDSQAVTSIVAAQLAGILGAWPAASTSAGGGTEAPPPAPTSSDRQAAAS